MSTWNAIARSKRVEWRRKEGRLEWVAEQYVAAVGHWFRVAQPLLELRTVSTPGTERLDCRPGKIMRGAVAGMEASDPTLTPHGIIRPGWDE